MTENPSGLLAIESWAGRGYYRLVVIGETSKRFRVRLMENVELKGWKAGDIRLVPKYAVRFEAPHD